MYLQYVRFVLEHLCKMCSVQVFDAEGEVKVELTIKLHSHSIQVTVIGMVMYLGASPGYIL